MRRSELFAGLWFAGVSIVAVSVSAQAAAPPSKPAEPPAAPQVPAQPPAGAPPSKGTLQPVEQEPAQPPPITKPPVAPAPLPAEPPATAPPPLQPVPMVPPLHTPAATPTTLTDEGPQEDASRLAPPESSVGPEVFAGMNGRLSDAEGFRDDDEHTGMTFGLGGWFAPNRTYSLGLTYQRTTLGAAQSAGGVDSLTARYDMNTFWFGGRAYPLRNDTVGLYVLLELGASWQEVSAGGTRPTSVFTSPAESFACSEADSPGLALGGGLGLDVDIERRLAFLVQADLSGHRLSSEVVDGCAPGIGSVTNVGARVGFLYRFDLDPRGQRTAATGSQRF
jgi:hypothetical protein